MNKEKDSRTKQMKMLILRYQVEQKNIKAELEYYQRQIAILEQQEILVDKIIKDLYFLNTTGYDEEQENE